VLTSGNHIWKKKRFIRSSMTTKNSFDQPTIQQARPAEAGVSGATTI